MRLKKVIVILLALVFAGLGSSAWAHGPRTRVGVYIGAPVWGPVWGPAWYPPPYYYPPQVVVVPPPQPTVYVEQSPPPATQSGQQYWHYCKSAKGYYPYVRECPEGWQKVLPQPEN